MSLFGVFDLAGTALSAQSVRLNVTASNLANAGTVSGSADQAYRPRHPVFAPMLRAEMGERDGVGVRVVGIVEGKGEPRAQYEPNHPLANEQGYIYTPDVSVVAEMANMISASRSYQSNVEVMNTSKQLLIRTLTLGQ